MKHGFRNVIAAATVLGLLALTGCGAGTGGGAKPEAAKTTFPTKAITLIVPYQPGGGTDMTARALAKAAEKHLGKSVAVVNKPGGGGAVGFTEGATAKPDGYTVTMVTVELTTLRHLGLATISYKDFKSVAQINFDPSAITVKVDAPWKNAKEFLDYSKAHPDELKAGNAGPGSIWHLSSASFEKAAGVKYTQVPFDGAAPAVVALMGGHVDVVFVSPAEVKAQVDGGKLRTLAIVDAQPSEALPGVKTVEQETGLKPTYLGPWRGLCVPKDTPDDVVKILTDAFMKAAAEPEFKDYMKKAGLGMAVKDSAGFLKVMADSDAAFAALIPTLNLGK